MKEKIFRIVHATMHAIKGSSISTKMCFPTLNIIDNDFDVLKLGNYYPILGNDINAFVKSKINSDTFGIIMWGVQRGNSSMSEDPTSLTNDSKIVLIYEDITGRRDVWEYSHSTQEFDSKGRLEKYPIGNFFN